MKTIVPDEAMLDALRALAHAEHGIEAAKEICSAAGWTLVDEEPGFARFQVDPPGSRGERHLVTVSRRPDDPWPFAFVTLHYFEEGRDEEPEDIDRAPFDRVYRRVARRLTELLGRPYRAGEYQYPDVDDWHYHYSWWRLEEASLALVQDEFDIQFGMDISLWVLPAGIDVTLPVLGE